MENTISNLEMKPKMFGSIHTHFESEKDTANANMHNMIDNFRRLGAKKVAVTDHGVMSAYEDLLTYLKKAKINDKNYIIK
jgi:DNA polymerase III alpha subunit